MHTQFDGRRLVSIALCFLLLSGVLTGCGDETAELMDTTVLVETQTAVVQPIVMEETYIAAISAENAANVYPLAAGTVTQLAVSVGDTVSAGDLLCQIDDESAQISLQNAQASYQSAQAGTQSAQASYQSAEAGTQSAQAAYQNAEAGTQSAEASYQNAQAGYQSAQAAYQSAQAAYQNAEAGYQSAQAVYQNAQAGYQSAQAVYQSALAGVESAEESYKSALAGYGGDEDGNLTVLEEQVRQAKENYSRMQTLLEAGAVSQVDVDQAYQTMISAQAGLESAQANLRAAQAGIDSAKANVSSAEAGLSSAEANVSSAEAGLSSAEAGLASAEAGLSSAEAGIASAEANLSAAEAGLTSANANVTSAEAGLSSANANLSAAQAGIQQAESGVQSAQAGIDSAEYQLSLYRVTAPISGVVEAVNVEENNLASSSAAAFIISASGAKTATFYVTEVAMENMVLGQSVLVENQGQTYDGVVTEISQSVDASRGLFQVKATLENAEGLANGASVSLTTVVQSDDNAVVVPLDALYFDNGAAYVYLSRDGCAVRQDVTTGIQNREEELVSILSGVSSGDEVVTTWSSTLKDGAAIRVAGEETADNADTTDTAADDSDSSDSSAAASEEARE